MAATCISTLLERGIAALRLGARTMHLIVERAREHKQENNIGKPQTFFMCGMCGCVEQVLGLGGWGVWVGGPWALGSVVVHRATAFKHHRDAVFVLPPMGRGGARWARWLVVLHKVLAVVEVVGHPRPLDGRNQARPRGTRGASQCAQCASKEEQSRLRRTSCMLITSLP